MPNVTLPAFTPEQYDKAKIYLATHVSEMMGRKFEEGDWAKVYFAAKGLPATSWSNLDIDVMHGNLGVEHKMLCRREGQSILDACGTSPMHPAGTRALRIPPGEVDATVAARDVLRQYGALIDQRASIVRAVNRFHHGLASKAEVVANLQQMGMGRQKAESLIPADRAPIGSVDDPLDMRTGWLLWQQSLREFLYFEEAMVKPDPMDFTAKWNERPSGGRRRESRNLWVYRGETKIYSITNEAGVKLQPYFTVPAPTDPNLYHFVVQGEDLGNGLIRVWLTEVTASLLLEQLGELRADLLADAIEHVASDHRPDAVSTDPFGLLAIEVQVPVAAYLLLRETFKGVSDEHNFKQLLEVMRSG